MIMITAYIKQKASTVDCMEGEITCLLIRTGSIALGWRICLNSLRATLPILQTSSEICGELPEDYKRQLGDILFSMLPAGSITGAPKKKTMQIIREAEGYERGFYTGITGYFDGDNMDSAVMIRFVEQEADGMYFKSGGGITFKSDARNEYEEMKQKIYVPIY